MDPVVILLVVALGCSIILLAIRSYRTMMMLPMVPMAPQVLMQPTACPTCQAAAMMRGNMGCMRCDSGLMFANRCPACGLRIMRGADTPLMF